MKGPWVKLWRSFLSDPTIQFLIKRHGDVTITVIIAILTSATDGVVDAPEDELAVMCNLDDDRWMEVVSWIEERGIIKRDEKSKQITIPNWTKYQEGDSASRMRKMRENNASDSDVTSNSDACDGSATECDAPCDGDVTPMCGLCDENVTGRSKKKEVRSKNNINIPPTPYEGKSVREPTFNNDSEPEPPEIPAPPDQDQTPTTNYPDAIWSEWQKLGDKVYQVDRLRFLNLTWRSIKPNLTGIHSDAVLQAIRNFGLILGAPPRQYYWTARIGIEQFTAKHLTKFLPENFKADDFRVKTNGQAEMTEAEKHEIIVKALKEAQGDVRTVRG